MSLVVRDDISTRSDNRHATNNSHPLHAIPTTLNLIGIFPPHDTYGSDVDIMKQICIQFYTQSLYMHDTFPIRANIDIDISLLFWLQIRD